MTGNVWEWVNDWYAADYFRRSPVDNPRGDSVMIEDAQGVPRLDPIC